MDFPRSLGFKLTRFTITARILWMAAAKVGSLIVNANALASPLTAGPVLKSPSVQLNSRSKFSSIQLVGARIEAELSWTFKKDGASLLRVESASYAHFVRTKSRKTTLLKFSWIKNGRKIMNCCERRWKIMESSPQLENVENERANLRQGRPHLFQVRRGLLLSWTCSLIFHTP